MTEPAMAAGGEALPEWEKAADQAIEACGGDARANSDCSPDHERRNGARA